MNHDTNHLRQADYEHILREAKADMMRVQMRHDAIETARNYALGFAALAFFFFVALRPMLAFFVILARAAGVDGAS